MDELFEVLANIHRRRLLVALLDHDSQCGGVRIPEEIHEGENPLEVLQTEFYHQHLPRLEERGVIRWNRSTHEVMKGPQFDEIRPLLELMDDHADDLLDDWL